MCLLGGEFMIVDRVVIAEPSTNESQLSSYSYDNSAMLNMSGSYTGSNRVFIPPDWAPWGFLSAGAITVLYGATLSRR